MQRLYVNIFYVEICYVGCRNVSSKEYTYIRSGVVKEY